MYVSYKLGICSKNLNTDFVIGNCLFEAVMLTKNADLHKYKYSSYGIGFDCRLELLFANGSMEKNIIFGANMSSSVHIDGRNKNILVFGEGPTQVLDNSTIKAKAKYPINFTESGKRFVLNLHYNGSNDFSFYNTVKIRQFKAKDSDKNHINYV